MAFSFLRKQQKQPDSMLPRGWQFYPRPNNLEPPGTIFRIDNEQRRYIVDRLLPASSQGREPGVSTVHTIETKMSVLARVLNMESWGAEAAAGRVRAVEFEMSEPIRESTTDGDMDAVLKPYLTKMEFKPNNRYYVIRETRSATAMKYHLSSEQSGELGAKAVLQSAINAQFKVEEKGGGAYDLAQTFPERLSVMYLPEEIAPVRAGLASGDSELGRVAVVDVLEWVEPTR